MDILNSNNTGDTSPVYVPNAVRDKICFADLTRGKYRMESAIWLLSQCGTTLIPAKKVAFIERRRRGGVLL